MTVVYVLTEIGVIPEEDRHIGIYSTLELAQAAQPGEWKDSMWTGPPPCWENMINDGWFMIRQEEIDP